MYKAEKSRTDLPKPIIFGEGRRAVVIGSDHGKAYVFNKRKGGPPVDTLVHSDDPTELVQSIAVRCMNTKHTVIPDAIYRRTTTESDRSSSAQHLHPRNIPLSLSGSAPSLGGRESVAHIQWTLQRRLSTRQTTAQRYSQSKACFK